MGSLKVAVGTFKHSKLDVLILAGRVLGVQMVVGAILWITQAQTAHVRALLRGRIGGCLKSVLGRI